MQKIDRTKKISYNILTFKAKFVTEKYKPRKVIKRKEFAKLQVRDIENKGDKRVRVIKIFSEKGITIFFTKKREILTFNNLWIYCKDIGKKLLDGLVLLFKTGIRLFWRL